MNKIINKKIAMFLTLIMVFSFLPLNTYANTAITVSLEVKGDSKMGTVYKKDARVAQGETAFNVLQMATEKNNIELEYDQEWKFVTAINGLSQQDHGPNSGWLYKVNGKSPDVGAGDYILNDGDKVLFYYTLDYSKEDNDETEDRYAPEIEYIPFNDRADISAWALESVEKAISLRIVSGDDKGNINPKKDITRAEFVKLLLLVMDEEPESTLSGMFTDVKKDAWYAYNVEKAAKLGLVNGVNGGLFLPNGKLTRQDMAVIIARAYDLEGTMPHTADANKISAYAKKSVEAVLENNIMTYVNSNNFAPKSNVTREMAITVMIRLLNM